MAGARPTPNQSPNQAEGDAPNSDWGPGPEKSGLSRENKFILFVLLILVAVFSFVIFRNFQKKGANAELATTKAEGSETKDKDAPKDESKKTPAPPKKITDEENAEANIGAEKRSPTLEEVPDQNDFANQKGDEFQEVEQPTTKRTAHRATQHRGTHPRGAAHSKSEEAEAEAEQTRTELADEEVAVAQPRTNRRTSASDEVVEEPVEEPELTPATRTRVGRRQSEESFEGSAEALDVPSQGGPKSDELLSQDVNEFEVDSKIDKNLEQTGGTADKGIKHRAGRRGQSEDQELLAQTDVPALPDETVADTIPRRTSTHRTTTNATQVSGAPTMRASNAGRVPPPSDPNEDKFGGMLPQEVGRRPAPTSGNFDPQAAPLVENTGEYVIRPNDNYWRISRKVYGTSRYFDALRLHNENVIPNSKNMKVGIRIATPSRELLEQQYKDILPAVAAPQPPGAVFNSPTAPKNSGYFVEPGNQPAYRVGPTDNLSSISQKTLGRSSRWSEIYELNRDRIANYDQLSVGSILRLPADASQPRLVGTPAVTN